MFDEFIGKLVRIEYEKGNAPKTIIGELKEVSEGHIKIETLSQSIILRIKDITDMKEFRSKEKYEGVKNR